MNASAPVFESTRFEGAASSCCGRSVPLESPAPPVESTSWSRISEGSCDQTRTRPPSPPRPRAPAWARGWPPLPPPLSTPTEEAIDDTTSSIEHRCLRRRCRCHPFRPPRASGRRASAGRARRARSHRRARRMPLPPFAPDVSIAPPTSRPVVAASATLPPAPLRFSASVVIAPVVTRAPVTVTLPPMPPTPVVRPLPPRLEIAPTPALPVALIATAPPWSPLPAAGSELASPASADTAPSATEAPVSHRAAHRAAHGTPRARRVDRARAEGRAGAQRDTAAGARTRVRTRAAHRVDRSGREAAGGGQAHGRAAGAIAARRDVTGRVDRARDDEPAACGHGDRARLPGGDVDSAARARVDASRDLDVAARDAHRAAVAALELACSRRRRDPSSRSLRARSRRRRPRRCPRGRRSSREEARCWSRSRCPRSRRRPRS